MTHAITPTTESGLPARPQRPESPLTLVPQLPEPAAPVTISATEMSRLTGVERERLRTWERRHGFPVPVRCANNVRRYLAGDVRKICAISRLSAGGVPLAEAIATVRDSPEAEALDSLGAALDGMRAPAIAVSGPRPLRVEWTNGATRSGADAPLPGDDLSSGERTLGPAAVEAIRALMVDGDGQPVTIEVTDWMHPVPSPREVLAWRVDAPAPGAAPVVVLTQLPPRASDAGPAVTGDSAAWARAVRRSREALEAGTGLHAVQAALLALSKEVGANDALVALQAGPDALRSARSVRGTVAGGRAALDECPSLAASLRDGQPDWLLERALLALGIDPRQRALAIPLAVADAPIGAALLVFRTEVALSDVARELLLGLGTALAAVIERERAAVRARGAA